MAEPEVFETPDVDDEVDASSVHEEQFDSTDIDATPVVPAASFEVFMGRRFAAPGPRRQAAAGAGGRAPGKPPREMLLETPLQAYQRLQLEVAELAQQLKDMDAADARFAVGGAAADGGEVEDPLAALSKGVHALQQQLAGLETTPHLATELRGELAATPAEAATQAALTASLAPVVDAGAGAGAGAGGAGPSTDAAPTSAGSATAASSAVLANLDKRLGRLERALGKSSAVPSAAGKEGGLLGALEALEGRLAVMDDAAFAEMEARATMLAAQVKASQDASKADGASGERSGAAAGRPPASDKELLSVLDSVQQWDAVSTQLPALVDRLQTLNTLHTEAALFTQRLASVETGQGELQALVNDTKAVVSELQSSFNATLAAVQDNVEALDKRFQSVVS